MNHDGRWAGAPAPGHPGGALPVTPYAIERPGPHQPTGPTRAPWNSTGNGSPPVQAPAWRSTPPAPQTPRPRTFAADAYAEAFLNGRPHPLSATPAPVSHTPPHPVSPRRPPPRQGPLPPQGSPSPQRQFPPQGPFPNWVVPLPIPAPSYAAQPPQHPPRYP